ncbi:Na+/H+ antiporter subunit G [Chromohalobacter sarecensis]|uniref:Na+/H+ antiporter subunit G n=1 Tax=Chromohalobacter sarecensis TaxID=245294 RepID=A0ABV9CZN1_9GAMM|nr:Na+/H+ antiporter subunit G [Chromohalobacter sarecensis]MCK0713746.1 Na+/H+ antiporter subunit G [Chromohalobacter sarecensis]
MIALYTLMEGIIAFFLIAGSIFALIGSLGLARMKDFYMRLHGPSKISTLGVGCILLASIAYFSLLESGPSLQELLITIFLFITAPVSAHLLSKSALHQKLERDPRTRGNPEELQEDDDEHTLEESPQGSSKLP